MKKSAFFCVFVAFTAALQAQDSIVNKDNYGLSYINNHIPRISVNIAQDTTTGSFATRALNVLYSHRTYYKLDDNDTFRVDEIRHSPAGTHVLVQQTRNGVKIQDAKGVVSFNHNGEISCVSLDGSSPNFNINTTPTYPLMDAINTITAHFSPKNTQIAESKAELVIIQKEDASQLAWQFYASPQGESSYWCAVDAHTNEILQCNDASAYYNPPQGSGKVFNPDPGSYLGIDNLPDSADANYFPVSTAYTIETLQGLIQSPDGKWRLQGEFAYAHDAFAPFLSLAEDTEPIFHYTRDNDHFEEVNAYFHLDKQMRYIRSLGFYPYWIKEEFTDSTAIVFDAHGFSRNNASFDPGSLMVKLGVPLNDVDLGEDLVVIAHELGHGWHYAFTVGGISDFQRPYERYGINEAIAEYFGLSYRRAQSLFQPNERMNWANTTGNLLPSIHSTDTLMFDRWPMLIDSLNSIPDSIEDPRKYVWQEYLRYIYASALMDLEYLDATNPALGVNLGRDVTHRLLCQSMHYVTSASDHVANVLAMFQADIDLYEGAHLPQLIGVYTRRKLFDQILTQMPANNFVNGIAMVNEGFEVPVNRTLTIDTLSYFVLNGNLTVQPNASLVFNERTRVFNPGNFTIHVNGTLQIAGNTTLPANIVVQNGGTLLINEGIVFAQQPGTVITVEQGGTVASNGTGVTLTIANNWVIEPGAVFQNIGNTENKGLVLQPTANMELENVTFLNTNLKGMGNFAFTNCLFTRSNLSATAEEILLEGCVFDRSVASLSVRSFSTTRADVLECQFLNGTGNYGLQLSGYQIFNVVNNRVEGNQGGGITVSNCGLSKPEDHLIRGNTIRNNTGGEALRLYNTVAVLMGNTISGNSHGIGLYHNCLVESFGDEGSPQTISYNGTVQVRAVDNSFPWRFSYNRFEANASDTLINCFYNTANGGTEEKYRVEMNCWPWDFNPLSQLVPSENFAWSPAWDCNGLVPVEPHTMAETLMIEGSTALNEDNTAFAKQRFEQVVAEFPQSPFALAALKSLRSVYYSAGYSPQAFKQYLESETALNSSPELQKIAGYLRAETDLFLVNTQQALEFYQSVIDNPATPADEVYATIDAEYAGLDVGNKALTASSFTTMLAKVEKHNKNRNLLLDGLKVPQTESTENQTPEMVADFILSPNPAKGFVDIAFSGTMNGNLTINLLSIDGRVVSSQTVTANPAAMKVHRINLPELNAGLYLVSIGLGNGHTLVRKLVVDTK